MTATDEAIGSIAAGLAKVGYTVRFKLLGGEELEGEIQHIEVEDEYMNVQVDGYIGVHRVRFDNIKAVWPPIEKVCIHKWIKYVGVFEVYYYCDHCDRKRHDC